MALRNLLYLRSQPPGWKPVGAWSMGKISQSPVILSSNAFETRFIKTAFLYQYLSRFCIVGSSRLSSLSGLVVELEDLRSKPATSAKV